VWNSLPAHLRQTDVNFERFQRLLKTFLFGFENTIVNFTSRQDYWTATF